MNCSLVNAKYQYFCSVPSDIFQHLPILKSYVEQCEYVIEFGVREIVSTWAMLAGNPKKMKSYDIEPPSKWGGDIDSVYSGSKECGIDYEFIIGDTTRIEIDECDLLFIDTLHEYDQMKKELELHENKVKKFLIYHDTISYRTKGERGGIGIYPAILEFLKDNSHWYIESEYTNNNGFMILERRQ